MLKPQPRVTEVNRAFWEGCNDGRLTMQRCRDPDCRKTVFYPRVCCPHCQGAELDWVDVGRRGRIVSHTTVHRPHHDGFIAEVPYVFAAIEIEGAILYAQVLEAPVDGTSLTGRAVSVEFASHGPDRRLAVFRLVAESATAPDSARAPE
jgi:uncharacterized OB-fold protein